MTRPLLFVAGEASGDRLAGAALSALPGPKVGIGGDACAAAGGELVAHLRAITATGVGDVLRRGPSLGVASGRLALALAKERPRAALLVDFTELNAVLGARLRAAGVPVLWCVAPQIWAWRPSRGPRLRRAMDRLAVLFAFEQRLWRGLGVDARWVGHPAIDVPTRPRAELRAELGLKRPTIAILPGSRPGVVGRLAGPTLAAAALLRGQGVEARLLVAPSLDGRARAALLEAASRVGVESLAVDARAGAPSFLGAFDAAIAATGTATLECALAGVPTVVVYRADALAAAVARRTLQTELVALPNVLLGRRAFAELLQEDATAERIRAAVLDALAAPEKARDAASELRSSVDPGDGRTTGERVADLVRPWIGRPS